MNSPEWSNIWICQHLDEGYIRLIDGILVCRVQGSISVSMSLHHTTFCFVCAHLTSGHNKGDELRRNGDVAEILRRSRFPRLVKMFGLELPETILEHE